MINPRLLSDLVFGEPFRPFRLHMASGRTFEVLHPEMIKIGKSSVTVYMRSDPDVEYSERWQEVSLMLLESFEPLDAKASTGSTA